MQSIMNFLKSFLGKRVPAQPISTISHENSVKQAAIFIFDKYEKTFKDLARYDRGEKIKVDSISH